MFAAALVRAAYSVSHCLMRMHRSATIRAIDRLVNQSALSQIAYEGALNGGGGPSGLNDGCVELTKDGLTRKLSSWAEICARMVSVWSGWRSWYDCTLNAVSMAENRPASSSPVH